VEGRGSAGCRSEDERGPQPPRHGIYRLSRWCRTAPTVKGYKPRGARRWQRTAAARS
jgi:hypothetical protein